MSENLVNFTCLRIQSELDKYQRSKTIPHDLLDGVWNVDDIHECMLSFTPKYERLANKLITEYSKLINEDVDALKKALRKEYKTLFKNARTRDSNFEIPAIMNKYRGGINPIRALFYEARNVSRRFNPMDDTHHLVADLVTDLEFNNKILDALAHDIKKLESIIKRYYWPLLKLDESSIPLELFHARQHMKDARHYYNFFLHLQNWRPDE